MAGTSIQGYRSLLNLEAVITINHVFALDYCGPVSIRRACSSEMHGPHQVRRAFSSALGSAPSPQQQPANTSTQDPKVPESKSLGIVGLFLACCQISPLRHPSCGSLAFQLPIEQKVPKTRSSFFFRSAEENSHGRLGMLCKYSESGAAVCEDPGQPLLIKMTLFLFLLFCKGI